MTLGAIPEARSPREDELEREEKAVARVVLVAVDHGANSQRAFSWALDNFLTRVDAVHLVHVLPKHSGSIPCTGGEADVDTVREVTHILFDKLCKEAYSKENLKVVTQIKDGEPGKELCAEAIRTKAVAIVLGSRGQSFMKSLLIGSTAEYCLRHSPVPLLIVPHHYSPTQDASEAGKSS